MSWKPIIWLLILVGVTAFFILVFERGADSTVRALPLETPLLKFSPNVITRLAITAGDLSIECERRDGQWLLIRPMEARADESRVKQIIEALADSRIRETLGPERLVQRRLTASSFGLESPRARVLVGTESHLEEILLGDESPLGDLVYLRLKGGDDVVGATCKWSDIIPPDLDSIRDRSVFPSGLKRVTRLELKHQGGFIQLALRDGQWRIQQPIDARADHRRVEVLIQSLMSLKVEAFGVAEAPSDPAVYGLTGDEAMMQISMTPEGGRAPVVLTVGKVRQDVPALLYARISDMSSLCSVKNSVLSLQHIKADWLRDRRLCSADPVRIASISLWEGDSKLVFGKHAKAGWLILEPFRFKADAQAVGTLLRSICELKIADPSSNGVANISGVGLASMSCRLSLSTVLPSGGGTNLSSSMMAEGTNWSYRFPYPGKDSTNSPVYCEETRSLAEVSPEELRTIWPKSILPLSLTDPRPYMDRQIFDITPDQVRRITLSRAGREETVTLGSDGVWVADSPPDGQVVKGAISALLTLASSLRAERIETMSATNVLAYGIDDSATRVTFGLTGASGIQKTVILGGASDTNGVYSMVQGQDVVFVLKQELMQALARPLVNSR